MPSATDLQFKIPFDLTERLAFQYCHNPKKDQPGPEQASKYQFIIVDEWFCYPDFQNYYGPSNLAHVIRFREIVQELYSENKKAVCVRTSWNSMQRSNVALLISSYLFFESGLSVDEICENMKEIYETVLDYRTEGEGACDHSVSIRDCLLGLEMALNHLPSLKLSEFNVEELLFMEQPQNGDMNWIVPGTLLALAGPTAHNWPISKFVQYAAKHSIGCMVRLNRAHYSANELNQSESIEIELVEMFMHDGTNPTPRNVRDFINIVDLMSSKGLAVAVHCRAGLGRTGTMIAAYLIFKYARDLETNLAHSKGCPCRRLDPSEVARAIIGFLRIMRPGSVLSGQPEFLENIAHILIEAGKVNNPELIESFETEFLGEIKVRIDTIESESESEEKDSSVIKIRQSKRLKKSSSSCSSDSFNHKNHPKSHAGKSHAAEKHSTVQVEKFE